MEEIYLRKMTYEDTDDIVRWRNSDAVRRNFIYQGEFTKEGHENWIRTMVETGKVVQMMIVERDTNKAVGSVFVRDIDYGHRKGEYGIFIGEDMARGKGYGTLAAKQMIALCFGELGLHKLMLRVCAANGQAIRSYEKAGFTKEAYLKDDVFVNGEYRDIVLMAIINEEKKA